MNIVERINKIDSSLATDFIHKLDSIIAIVLLIIVAILIFLNKRDTKNGKRDEHTFGYFVIFILSLVIAFPFVYWSTASTADLKEQRELLLEVLIEDLEETDTLVIDKVKKTAVVKDYQCPTVSLNEVASCVYIEFESDSEINHLYMPLNEKEQKELSGAKVNYYIVPEEVSDFLAKEYHLQEVHSEFKENNHTHVLRLKWAFGVEIVK